MDVCAGSQARRRADRGEIALQVRGDAFLICGYPPLALLFALLGLFTFLALLECWDLFGRFNLFGCFGLFRCRAAHYNYCQQCHGAGFPH